MNSEVKFTLEDRELIAPVTALEFDKTGKLFAGMCHSFVILFLNCCNYNGQRFKMWAIPYNIPCREVQKFVHRNIMFAHLLQCCRLRQFVFSMYKMLFIYFFIISCFQENNSWRGIQLNPLLSGKAPQCYAQYFIILLCQTPDNFTPGESTATEWVITQLAFVMAS